MSPQPQSIGAHRQTNRGRFCGKHTHTVYGTRLSGHSHENVNGFVVSKENKTKT